MTKEEKGERISSIIGERGMFFATNREMRKVLNNKVENYAQKSKKV